MTGPAKTLGNRLAPPRFIAFALLLPLGAALWRWIDPVAPWQDALAMGFDLAAALFLLSLIPLLRDFPVAEMRRHADENDANRTLIVVVSTLLALVVMASISGELTAARGGDPLAMGKLLVTLVLAWLFANSVYALHYAHSYYFGSDAKDDHRGGIEFPGTRNPDYSDFAYFAFTLGMTFQTSDVQVTAPSVRRLVLVQSLASFVFNIGVIAFTINALG
ncbi:MAG: DUF1345 domain-containing protein [Sphingomonadaceae bacterium]|nr:DUF1345 domain-containing protein [Sphingomonadaceae bacterium]